MENFTWPQDLKSYLKPSLGRSIWQFSSSLSGFFLLWYLMYLSLPYSYWLTLALALPASGFLVRLFIINHDCSHGSFFASKEANKIVGRICAFLTFTPYYFWKDQHAVHHRTSGNLDFRSLGGDVWMMTTQEYKEANLFTRVCYRIYRNPPLYLGILSPLYFVFGLRYNFGPKNDVNLKKKNNSIHLTNLALIVVITALCFWIGVKNFLMIEIPIIMLSTSAGVWLFYVQHQYENVVWERNDTWNFDRVSLTGSSFYKLPKILQWFSGNIGFHHVHHLNPRVPNYYLQKCHEKCEQFRNIKPLTFWRSLKATRLKLWDEEKGKMVGYHGY